MYARRLCAVRRQMQHAGAKQAGFHRWLQPASPPPRAAGGGAGGFVEEARAS